MAWARCTARDTKLNRDVAIKVLRGDVVHDAGRLARFAREALTLGALNHPNIAHIHGLEESGAGSAIVMELVGGSTLADRIARGAIPLEESLTIARQIAEAVEAAHGCGVIHRDLKPANIKIRPDGIVKVLDFGLAKAIESEPADADPGLPTLTMDGTAHGVILGSTAYMSPEQASGQAVDKRTDIWAFGVVLYEMLTGTRAFAAADVSTTLTMVLAGQLDWSRLPPSTPPLIVRLLRRSVEKDLRRRLPDIAVARLDLDEAVGRSSADASGAIPLAMTTAPPRRGASAIVAGAAVAAIVASFVTWMAVRSPAQARRAITRFGITLPAAQRLSPSFTAPDVALSSDGAEVVHVGGRESQLMMRQLSGLDAVPIAGITNARAPFFSPDGRWIGFSDQSGMLRKVSVTGGPAIAVCRIEGQLRGASWASDDTIVFATSDPATGLLRVAAGGGEPTVLTRPLASNGASGQDTRDHFYPFVLPRGRGVLFTTEKPGATAVVNSTPDVAVLDLRSGEQKTLVRGASQAAYAESGHLLYATGGTLWAAPFDLDGLRITGDQMPVVQGVRRNPMSYSVSQRGTLVYVPDLADGARILIWVDRHGQEQPIASPPAAYSYPRLSPDNAQVAFTSTDRGNTDTWTWDFRRQTATRLTFDPSAETYPVWMPDGQRIAFRSIGAKTYSLLIRAADGTGTPDVLAVSPYELRPTAISPDGQRLFAEQMLPDDNAWDIVEIATAARRAGSPPETKMLVRTPFDERNATVSPDGNWLAYESNESGQTEIYVRSLSSSPARYQLSNGGGRTAVWSRDGRELFFTNGSRLLTSRVQLAPTFSHDTPAMLFDAPSILFDARTFNGGSGRMFDVSRDGQRFLMVKRGADSSEGVAPNLIVVENWPEELKQRLQAR